MIFQLHSLHCADLHAHARTGTAGALLQCVGRRSHGKTGRGIVFLCMQRTMCVTIFTTPVTVYLTFLILHALLFMST